MEEWLNLIDYEYTEADKQQFLILTRGEFLDALYEPQKRSDWFCSRRFVLFIHGEFIRYLQRVLIE